jgi:hypothetical protein
LGLDKISSALITEKMALSAASELRIGTRRYQDLANRIRVKNKKKISPFLATGEKIAYALEPSSGSDALGAKTTAKLNAEGTL